jgi:catechol-2,3-dioxygenase
MAHLQSGPIPRRLTHLALRVRSIATAVQFYRDVLGLSVERQGERIAFLTARGATSHDLALFALGDDAPGPEPSRVGMYHMAWEMDSFDDLQALYDRLVEQGANVCGFSNSATMVSVSLFDPDGNELEVLYELPKSEWPAERVPGVRFPREFKKAPVHQHL